MTTIYTIIEGYGGCGYANVYATTNEDKANKEWDMRRKELLDAYYADFAKEEDADLSLDEQWDAYMDHTDEAELYFDEIELDEEEEEDE